MDRVELVVLLTSEGVKQSSYTFDADSAAEQYVLERDDDGWVIYYAERGDKVGRMVFSSESEACSQFAGWLLEDPTTREG